MNLFRRWVRARVASLCGAVLPGKVLQEEGGWGEGKLQGHCCSRVSVLFIYPTSK